MAPQHNLAENTANWMQYIGSSIGVVFSFINQYAAAIGVLIAILGFLVNWYYKHKSFLLRESETQARNRRFDDPKYYVPDESDE
jgi:hypothetical protein